MSCNAWNDEWVARIYDEVSPSERETIDGHLAGCASCRDRMERLRETRTLLADYAPETVAGPRVIVLPAARGRARGAWSFAGGFAAAAALFLVGLFVGVYGPERPQQVLLQADAGSPDLTDPAQTSSEPAGDPGAIELVKLRKQYETLQNRIGRIEGVLPAVEGESNPALLTEDRLQNAVGRLNQEFDLRRAHDLQVVFEAILAADTEARQRDTRLGQVLQVMNAMQDPAARER